MTILNIGSGPAINGNSPGLEIVHADNRYFGSDVETQDMENLEYPKNSFDLVHCVNALDHTKDAEMAVSEMIRVSNRWVYIKCWLDQKDTGYRHYWNAKQDGTITNGLKSFNLKDFGFKVEYTELGDIPRYNFIV